MGKCDVCEREMTTAKGCGAFQYVLKDGTKVAPVKAGEDDDWVEQGERCGDCGAKHGHYHHLGCDIERCRLCRGQIISCDCDYGDHIEIFVVETPAEKARRQAGERWDKMNIEERAAIGRRVNRKLMTDKQTFVDACVKIVMDDMKADKAKNAK